MNIAQIKKKVEEKVDVVRVYWATRTPYQDETWYFGQRGHLTIDDDGSLVFFADTGKDKDQMFYISKSSEIHAPSIGHYSW